MDKKIPMNVHKAIRVILKPRNKGTGLPFKSGHKSGGREQLVEVFNKVGFKKGAEIGVRDGKFSLYMLNAIPDLKLICVDPWKAYSECNKQWKLDAAYKVAVEKLSKFNVKILKKSSFEALNDVEDASLDFVYIDGNHEFDYVCADIIFWSRKVRSGGIIACHDYVHWCGVVAAVDTYTRSHHIDPWYVTGEVRRNTTAFWINP